MFKSCIQQLFFMPEIKKKNCLIQLGHFHFEIGKASCLKKVVLIKFVYGAEGVRTVLKIINSSLNKTNLSAAFWKLLLYNIQKCMKFANLTIEMF